MATPEHSQEERLLEQETAIHFESYDDLLKLIQSIPMPPAVHRALGYPNEPSPTLPNELCAHVLQWLWVERIQMSQVSVIGCSSISTVRRNGYQPALADCLSEDESTWWLSTEHPDGQNQYVDFFVATPTSRVVQIQKISIKIPPYPQGPFALRDFYVLASSGDVYPLDDDEGWKRISPQWTLDGEISGWQSFVWNHPIDVRYLRLLCLSNQWMVGPNPEERRFPMILVDAVGFYSVRFD